MAGIARGDVEILVHTTAPSRGQDDAQYRALAQAYLDFEPATRQRLDIEAPKHVEETNRQTDSQLQKELALSTQEERESRASYRPDDEEEEFEGLGSFNSQDLALLEPPQLLDSPELSFNSAINNADSPVFRGMVTREEHARGTHSQEKDMHSSSASWDPPRSVISDSQPEQQGLISAFASPARVLELYLHDFNAITEGSQGTRGKSRREKGEVIPPRSNLQNDSSSVPDQATVQLPSLTEFHSSPSAIKSPTRRLEITLANLDNSMASTQSPVVELAKKIPIDSSPEDLHISASAPTTLARNSFPLLAQINRPQVRHQTEPPSSSPSMKSDLIPSNRTTILATSSAGSEVSPWAELLEIRPSPPQTSTTELRAEMLITKDLHQLSQRMPLAVLYKPISQSRDLRPMERGYWIVNCHNWNVGLRKRSWNCLGNFVGNDMAGWGVSVVRSDDHEELRAYCWGIIVGHIYLLLYLASEGKVKGTGACWRGGDGEAIIKMES